MAATRNKNTKEDYFLQEWSKNKIFETKTYLHASQGQAINPHYAGNGLIGGKMHAKELAYNDCDIESYLRGIGSTNLVSPKTDVTPQYKDLNSLNVINKKQMIMPDNLIIEPNQRQNFLN